MSARCSADSGAHFTTGRNTIIKPLEDRSVESKRLAEIYELVHEDRLRCERLAEMKREAGGLGEFLLCPQGKAASPRFMGVIVLGDVC